VSRHPSVEAITRFFEYDHLPEPLKSVASECSLLKTKILNEIEDDPELTAGLRKLLEAKDCFVRAAVAQENRKKANPSEGKPI
jgi:hypothetical protein